MIDRNKTRAYFQKRLVDNIAGLPFAVTQIIWPNIEDSVDKTSLWVRVGWNAVDEDFSTFGDGGSVEMADICTIEVFAPITGGTKELLDATHKLKKLYRTGHCADIGDGDAVYIDKSRPLTISQQDLQWHREAMQFIYTARGPITEL